MTPDQAKAAITKAFEQYMMAGFKVKKGNVKALTDSVTAAGGGQAPSTFRLVLDFDPQRKAWHAVYHAP